MPQPAHNPLAAGLPRRLAAIFYDTLAILALMFAIAAVATALNDGRALSSLEGALNVAWQATLVLAWILYLGISWRMGHCTLGMRAWQLRLVTPDGKPIAWSGVFMRWSMGLLGTLLLGAGYLWGLFRDDHRCWPDLASGTTIVRDRPIR